MEQGFEIIPDTENARMRIWGKDLKELFRNALSCVASYLKSDMAAADRKDAIRRPIKIQAVDLNSLLIEFLSETLSLSDMHNAVFTTASFKNFGDNFLKGIISGVKIESFEKDIKAILYDEVDIKKNPETGMYETILVFDV